MAYVGAKYELPINEIRNFKQRLFGDKKNANYSLKVAPYSFLKSGEQRFETLNFAQCLFARIMKLNVLYKTA